MLHTTDGPLDDDAWDLFLNNAPEEAVAELREAAKDDPYGDHGMRLARHLGEHDNVDEAIQALEGLLAQNPENLAAVDYLAELDPARGLELLAASVAASPRSAEAWTRYAGLLQGAGRDEEAVEAGLAGFRLAPDSWPADYLLEAAPNEIVNIFHEHVKGSLDDELWGDYGDTLWRAQRADEALEAWKRARSIDNDDVEWIQKIQQLQAGGDPFGSNEQVEYFGGLGYVDSDVEFSFGD